MLEAIQRVHPLAGASRSFFVPAFAAGPWTLTIEEFLAQALHITASLHRGQIYVIEIKLVAVIVGDLVFG